MALQLDKWQEDILKHDGHLLLCTGRQVGKTYIFSRKAAEYMVQHEKSKVIVVSLTEDQAQLMIIMILTYLEHNYRKMIAKRLKRPTKTRVFLTNGSSVIARPVGNTGDAVRGFTGDILIVDEASRMPELMWTAATPTLATTGGQIWMCSTPFGKQGYFYKSFLNKNNRYKVFHVNTPEVYRKRKWENAYLQKEALRFLKDEQEEKSELEFGQEYLGLFLEDLKQLFPDDLTRERMLLKRDTSFNTSSSSRDLFLGVDIGRLGEDPSTFEIFERHDDMVLHRDNQITTKTRLTETADHIMALNGKYNFRKIYIDDEGIGIGVLDMLLANDETKRKTEGLKNSKKIMEDKKPTRMLKIDLYMNMLRLMEQKKIQLLDDPNIFLSFKSIQYEYTKDKKGKPFMHIFGNDSHIVEGCNRAAWCVKQKHLRLFVDYF